MPLWVAVGKCKSMSFKVESWIYLKMPLALGPCEPAVLQALVFVPSDPLIRVS